MQNFRQLSAGQKIVAAAIVGVMLVAGIVLVVLIG
jgi:hypothetical protein